MNAASVLALFGTFGTGEMVIIFLVVLIIFGPKAIPQLAKSIGQGVREFRSAASKVNDELHNEAEASDRAAAKDAAPAPRIAAAPGTVPSGSAESAASKS